MKEYINSGSLAATKISVKLHFIFTVRLFDFAYLHYCSDKVNMALAKSLYIYSMNELKSILKSVNNSDIVTPILTL